MASRLLICQGCTADAAGVELASRTAKALRDAGIDIDVAYAECLGCCATPVAIALQGDGLASYVFAGLTGIEDIGDIVATCRTWRDSPDGWIEDARACGRLRHLLRARLPALNRP